MFFLVTSLAGNQINIPYFVAVRKIRNPKMNVFRTASLFYIMFDKSISIMNDKIVKIMDVEIVNITDDKIVKIIVKRLKILWMTRYLIS